MRLLPGGVLSGPCMMFCSKPVVDVQLSLSFTDKGGKLIAG